MAKKRKSEATLLDEVDRTLYSTFCSAANSLSQLYTQSMQHQRLSFHAGERHGLEKLYNWLLRQQGDGARVTTGDIVAYIQNEEPQPPHRLPLQLPQQSQTSTYLPNAGSPVSSAPFYPETAPNAIRSGQSDQQPKNNVFSNALSSPIRRSLQHYHPTQGGYPQNVAPGGTRHSDNNNYLQSSNDTSMDMHSDTPDHEFPY